MAKNSTPKKVKSDSTPTPKRPEIETQAEQAAPRRNPLFWAVVVFAIIAAAVILAGCTSTVNALQMKPIKAKDERAAICEWNKKAGLPITLQSRKEIPGKWRTGGAFRDAYLADVKTVVGINLKHECYCGSEERRIQLRCDELEAAPQEG